MKRWGCNSTPTKPKSCISSTATTRKRLRKINGHTLWPAHSTLHPCTHTTPTLTASQLTSLFIHTPARGKAIWLCRSPTRPHDENASCSACIQEMGNKSTLFSSLSPISSAMASITLTLPSAARQLECVTFGNPVSSHTSCFTSSTSQMRHKLRRYRLVTQHQHAVLDIPLPHFARAHPASSKATRLFPSGW